MRFLAELVNTYGPPPASALGSKPESPLELALRTEEAGRLTFLLLSRQSFSFVRVGDLDLALILASQFNTRLGSIRLQFAFIRNRGNGMSRYHEQMGRKT